MDGFKNPQELQIFWAKILITTVGLYLVQRWY